MSARRRWQRPAMALVAVLAAGCGSTRSPVDGVPYLHDAVYRRSELEASLTNPQNGYSRLRLAHYATGTRGDWDQLPEWNPIVEPIAADELDQPGGASARALSPSAAALVLPRAVVSEDDPALLALGRAAFERYPVQLSPYLAVALSSRDAATRYGLWVASAGVGGLVRARMADGSSAIAVTCGTCHARPKVGAGNTGRALEIEEGPANAQLDLGAAMIDANGASFVPAVGARIAVWGPGRLDVTTSVGSEPARIADLRPARFQSYLHQDATIANRNLTTMAIRIETLIITSSGEVLRPPRVIALALAAYVRSLADALPPVTLAEQASPRGAYLFASHCASCHVPPEFTGPPVPLGAVGTDPSLGMSPERGTGAYRAPSLRGVGTRGPLLHDGTVPSIAAMLDPERLTPAFSGRPHGAGAVLGHPFGLDLDAADRNELIAYLSRL